MNDFSQLNSATKYPSIETYHTLNPKNGGLLEEVVHDYHGEVLGTEKVDGGNGRIIIMPSHDYFIGSREEITYASGDRIVNPMGSIVPTLLPLVDRLLGIERSGLGTPGIETYFFEVFGHRIGGGSKNYTKTDGLMGARLFDMAWAPMVLLEMEVDSISNWRKHGGQKWAPEDELQQIAKYTGIDLTPRLGTIDATELPTGIEDMQKFLNVLLPLTHAALDETANGKGEGIVFRTKYRAVISKAKFQDYERTMRLRTEGEHPRKKQKNTEST